MSFDLMPVIWTAVSVLVLLLLQRWIHTHLHGLSLLITGRPQLAVVIYAIVLLPGVFLHELSHWLTATLLGVRTGRFSIIPQRQPDGSIQLGYVEYYRGATLGAFRESLIGGAPLIMGTAVILLIGFRIFGITELAVAIQSGQVDALTLALGDVFRTPDFLVWLYLLFAVSNAMMPSRSDRRAWPAFFVTMLILIGLLYVLGILNVLMNDLVGPLTTVFGYLGLAFSMAIGVDLVFMGFIALLEEIISRIKGVRVVYGSAEAPPGTDNLTM
ncbi:MAG: hypothetical protein D6706_13120 [Chloroflexi bacterium]|nr:MAG: hypothetical protein D6706_13120 [Chloroflexota bacterium]